MLYRLTFDNVAFSSAPPAADPIELEADLDRMEVFNESRPGAKDWPEAIVAVTAVTASPDDSVYRHGRRDGVAKLFVSVEVLIDVENEKAVEALAVNGEWLKTAAGILEHEHNLDFEETWDLLDYEMASPPPPAREDLDPVL